MLAFSESKVRNKEFCQTFLLIFDLVSYINGNNKKHEHRMIHSLSNTTSYSTFYAFFSPFRITLRPMWLVNSKRQPCFYPPQPHAQEDTQN